MKLSRPVAELPIRAWAQNHALVLVVVEDAQLLRMIVKALGSEYRLATAVNGEDGFVQAVMLQPDLIVSDIRTEGSTVSDMLLAVRRRQELAEIPFLTLMDGVQETVALCSSNEGGDDYLSKPFLLSDLRARIALLRQSSTEFTTLRTRASECPATLLSASGGERNVPFDLSLPQ